MTDAAATEQIVPFESASELREAHAKLLDALDLQLGRDASASAEADALARLEADIREFLARGAATGVFLEEIKERTACQVLLDYWLSSLAQVAIDGPSARLAPFDGAQLPDLKDKPCPYVGLEAFRGKEFFFGRESDTQALVAQLREAPLVVVFGASGSGKSSLVMGGVLPALAAADGAPALRIVPTVVPGDAVLHHLEDAVLQARGGVNAQTAGTWADASHLSGLVGGADAPPTLVSIDQFEEVFTLSDAHEREELVANLAALLALGRGHRVLLAMREEFRSRLVELRAFSPYLDKAWYSMRPMGYEELRAAVERPGALVNLQFQSGIVDDLVKKVLGQPAALPLLQFTLRALWDRRDRNRITWEVYRRVGDPLNALRTSADGFYDALAPQTQDEVRRILLELVRVDELLEAYRQPVRMSRLLQAGKANTGEVLELLADHDYVRITPGGGSGGDAIVEVKHESLIRNWPRLVGWIDEKRIERRQRLALTQAAQHWSESGRPPEGLLTGWQLQDAKRQTDLSELEREFVEASAEAVNRAQREKEEALRREAEQAKALAQAEQRGRRRMKFALALVVMAALLIGGFAIHFWLKSQYLDRRSEQLKEEKTELSRQKSMLQENYARLKAAYDELFAKQVRQEVAPASRLPSGHAVTIFLQISAAEQRPRAEQIALQLRENGIRVPGVEQVTPVAQSEVRYFREEDEPGAQLIVSLLNKYLGVEVRVKPTLVKGFEHRVPGRQYEIWFAPDAFPSPYGLPEPNPK